MFSHPLKKIICYLVSFQIIILSFVSFHVEYTHAAQTIVLNDDFNSSEKWNWKNGADTDYAFENGRVKNTSLADKGWLYNLSAGNEKTVTVDVYQDSDFIKDDAYTFMIVGKDQDGNYPYISYSFSKMTGSSETGDTDSVSLREYTCTIPSNYVALILTIRYNAGMYKDGVPTTPGKVEISRLVVTEQQLETSMVDNLDNWNKTNWHSVSGQGNGLGDLEFNTSNSNGFGDISTVRQASDSWSIFNYNLNGAKTFRATVFTKTDITSGILSVSASPSSDGSGSTSPTLLRTGWTALQNGWFKVNLVSALPDGTNYVTITLKCNGDNKLEVGSVRISTTAEALPSDENMPAPALTEITDNLDNWSKTNWHSVSGQGNGLGDLAFNITNSNGFGDTSTVRQASDSWSIFNYNINGAKILEATVFTKTNITSGIITINASPNANGSGTTNPPFVRKDWTELQNGWFMVTLLSALPEGTNYAGITLKGNGSNKPEIGYVRVSKTEEILPQDSNPPSQLLSVQTSYSSSYSSYSPPIIQQDKTVSFENLAMVNWHTNNITIDRSNIEGFNDTSPKIVRMDNTLQALNFMVSDVRRAESVVYFKGAQPPLGLQYTLDNKNWVSIDYEIRIEKTYSSKKLNTPIVFAFNGNIMSQLELRNTLALATQDEDTADSWKKATVIGVFPEGTKAINFSLLPNEEGAKNPQLANVEFKKEAGTISINSNKIESVNDKMANWYKPYWHTDGLTFETGNAELFDNDNDRLVRTDNEWQCVNYKLEGLRRVEVDIFYKGETAPISIGASIDNKEWGGTFNTYIEGIANLKDGWKKAKAIVIIPEGYSYAGIQMLKTEDKNSDIKIGNIKITKIPGEAGPVKNGVLEDNLNDWYLTNWHSTLKNSSKYGLGDLEFNTSNQNGFKDESTVRQASDEWAVFSYKMDKVRRFEAVIYSMSAFDSTFAVEAGTKQDGSDYKACPYVITNWQELQNGWYKFNITSLLPEGTSYVNIKLTGSKDNKTEIGNIKLSEETGEPPVPSDKAFAFEDSLNNWARTSWHSTAKDSGQNGLGDLKIGAASDPVINDTSTVRLASDNWASFNYMYDGVKRIEATVYTKGDLNGDILSLQAGTMQNGSDFKENTYSRSVWKDLGNGWYEVNVTALFPDRTKYVGFTLKKSTVEIGHVKLFKTAGSLPEDENPPITQLIDFFTDWSIAGWHSDGVFLEKADPEIFSSNINIAAVKNSSWQGLNYKFADVRRVEVIAYHKTATPNVLINSSTDNKSWNNLVQNILVSTENVKKGYKMSQVVALVPKNTNYIGVQFLANSQSDISLKIAKVTLSREAGTIPKGTLLNSPGTSAASGNTIMRPGMEDPLKDWNKVSWHSDGIVFVKDNAELFGDSDRVMRTSDTWQGITYKIEGVRRIEAKIFFKGESSPTFINVSDDSKEWYNVPWHIGKITSIDGEWKTSTAYAIIPESAKHVTVQMLESKTGSQTPQIGHVRFFKDPGELPPSMRDVLEDPLDDFSLSVWHSDGLKIIKDDGKSFENDTSRFGRANNSWQGVTYNIPGVRRADVRVYYTDYPAININMSYDNKNYMEMKLIKGKPEILSGNWKSVMITAILPQDAKYIGIGMGENKGGPLSPQIGSITLSKSVGEVPVNFEEEKPANAEKSSSVKKTSQVKKADTKNLSPTKENKKSNAVKNHGLLSNLMSTSYDAIIEFWYLVLILLTVLCALPFKRKILSFIKNKK